ncbi:MAG: hypothetical protein CL512_05615 [Actinobacteria bacterium]|nr:hypothetical protein [Actinomycetota bacterium]|tara:strand:- start:5750 stop:5944 length:195 start_codon:yes stop_codon:yes gene_type:complete
MQDPNIEQQVQEYILIDSEKQTDEQTMYGTDYSKYKKYMFTTHEAQQLNYAFALNHTTKRYVKV